MNSEQQDPGGKRDIDRAFASLEEDQFFGVLQNVLVGRRLPNGPLDADPTPGTLVSFNGAVRVVVAPNERCPCFFNS